MAIIKREDDTYFTGNVDGGGRPYQVWGPYPTIDDARRKAGFDRVINPSGILAPDADEQDFDPAHPDAVVWADQNGDEFDINSWQWTVIEA